jgi:hypothetical protein
MKKIIISALNIFLLSSLFFGVTLAFFTDTIVNEGNIITLGNLKVSLVAADNLVQTGPASYNLGTTNLQDLKTIEGNNVPLFDFDGRVEPGQSLARFVRVRNAGSIMMDYELSFEVNEAFLEEYVSFAFRKVNLSNGTLGPATTKLGDEFSGVAFSGTELVANAYEIYQVTITIDSALGNDFNFETLSDDAFDFDVVLTARQSSQPD